MKRKYNLLKRIKIISIAVLSVVMIWNLMYMDSQAGKMKNQASEKLPSKSQKEISSEAIEKNLSEYCKENGLILDVVIQDLLAIGVNGSSLVSANHGGYASYEQYVYVQTYMAQYYMLKELNGDKFFKSSGGDYGTLNTCLSVLPEESPFSVEFVNSKLGSLIVSPALVSTSPFNFNYKNKEELITDWNAMVKSGQSSQVSAASQYKYDTSMLTQVFEITPGELASIRAEMQRQLDPTGKKTVTDEQVLAYATYQKAGYYSKQLEEGTYGTNAIFSDLKQWNELDEALYSQVNDQTLGEDEGNNRNVGLVEGYFSGVLAGLAEDFLKWQYSWKIDLTIEGLVYGRMASSYNGNGDLTHFGMETNNPYGIISSIVYNALEMVVFTLMPIIIMGVLIGQVMRNGKKERAEFKEFVYKVVMVYLLIYIMPYAINLLIYVRDAALSFARQRLAFMTFMFGFTENASSLSFVTTFHNMYDSCNSLTNAFFYLAASSMFLFFLGYYIAIACLLTACFALFPLVALMSIWNKRILTDWFNVFFPNFMMPFIDMVLIFLPVGIMSVWVKVMGGSGTSVSIAVIEMLVIFATLKVRQRAIKLLGFDGIGGGSAGAGLVGAAMMLSRTLGGAAKKVGGKPQPERVMQGRDISSAMSPEEAKTRGEVLSGLNSNLPNIASIEEESGWKGKATLGDEGQTKDFLKELEDTSQMDRFENLARLDTAREGLGNVENELAQKGFDQYRYNELGRANAELGKDLGNIDNRLRDYNISDEERNLLTSQRKEKQQLLNSNKSEMSAFSEDLKKRDALRSQIDKRTALENQYAHNERMVGMRGNAFSSTDEFKAQKKMDDVKKSLADYKNFDSGAYKGVLSPKEQEKFLKQRERAQQMDMIYSTATNAIGKAAHVATATASIGAGVVGMAGGMYGGPQAMVGGMAGGMKAVQGAGGVVSGTADTARRVSSTVNQRIVRPAINNVSYGRRPGANNNTSNNVSSNASSGVNSQTTQRNRVDMPDVESGERQFKNGYIN